MQISLLTFYIDSTKIAPMRLGEALLGGVRRRLGFNTEAPEPETYLVPSDRPVYAGGIMASASRFTNGEYIDATGVTTTGPICTLRFWMSGDEAGKENSTVHKGYKGAVIKFGDKEITVAGFGEKKEENNRGGTLVVVNIPHVRLMI